jgi:hypothetical protein
MPSWPDIPTPMWAAFIIETSLAPWEKNLNKKKLLRKLAKPQTISNSQCHCIFTPLNQFHN